tara:strand:+ start:503 stop:658 length:156 start_codon:yes stop_codon:yes gene_type:complete
LRLKFFGVRLKKWTGQQEAILTPRNLKKGIILDKFPFQTHKDNDSDTDVSD